MTCNEYQKQIQADPNCVDLKQDVHAHVQGCSDCHEVWKEVSLASQLKALSQVPEMSAGFAERLQQKMEEKAEQLAQQEQASHDKEKQPWLAYSGVAAMFLLVGLFLQPMLGAMNDGGAEASRVLTKVSVMPQRFETIDVMLDSYRDYEQAELAISVSGAVRFDPNDSIQTVSWQTALKQGKNVLPVPVYLLNAQGGKLTITMKADSGYKEMEIEINALAEKANGERYL